jgi:hypothetical protein
MPDYRNKRTKEVRFVKGNTPEGRQLASADEWVKVGSAGVPDESEQMPPGVQDAPTPEPATEDD